MTEGSCISALRGLVLIVLLMIPIDGCRKVSVDDTQSEPVAPTLAVSTAKVVVAPMTRTLRLLGTTAATHQVVLRAPVGGRVIGMHLKIGDRVQKNEQVARVLSLEVEAARQGLQVAKKIDPQDAPRLEQSVNKYGSGNGIPVIAPEGGVVSAPPVVSGQVVAYLDPLADLVDPNSVYVDAAVPAENMHAIRIGMPATIKSPLKPGLEMPGRVAAVMPNFNAGSATSAVRIEFTSPERILESGAPTEVMVTTHSVPDAIAIPTAALFQDDNGAFHVFVAGADGRAHRTPVTLGIRNPEQAQALTGLAPGDSVITSGGYALSDGLRVSVEGAK